MHEDKIVWAFFDTSGSNFEMGKGRLNRNLCRTLFSLRELNPDSVYEEIDFKTFTFSESVSPIVFEDSGDVKNFSSKGKSSLSVLSSFLIDSCNPDSITSILLFSDGGFDFKEIENFKRFRAENQNIKIYSVAIGIDANVDELTSISDKCFYPDNVLKAVDYAIEALYRKVIPPIYIKDFL